MMVASSNEILDMCYPRGVPSLLVYEIIVTDRLGFGVVATASVLTTS